MAATLAKVESKCKYIVQRLSDTGDQLDKPGDQASAQDTRLRMKIQSQGGRNLLRINYKL